MSSENKDQLNGRAIYAQLLGYVKPYWKAFIFVLIGMVLVAGTEVGFAALMKPMLDGTFVEKDPFYVTFIPIAIVVIFSVRGIGSFGTTYCMSWVGRHVIKDLRREMFDKLLTLPTRFYDKNASGQLISKVIYDVEQVADAASRAISVLIQDSLTLIGLLAWMFYLNWKLSLLFLTIGPLLSLLVVVVNKRLRRVSRRLQESVGDVTHISQEAIDAQRVIKIFGGHAQESNNFSRANEKNRLQFMKIVSTNALSVPLVQLVAACLLALIVYLATRPEMQDTITVGTFMSFIAAMLLLFPPLKRLTTVNVQLQRGITAAHSVFVFLDEPGETDSGKQSLQRASGQVEYKNVGFTYESEKGTVLEDVSFSVEAGKTVAFVGRSGSGKTTLLSLLPRFYNHDHGEVLIDGIPVQNLSLRDLRRQIALVSQDITLFNDTIAHNIAYGSNDSASNEQIVAAAEAAHAMDFIRELPNGLDTVVGEHGMMLSGGQRQRLAIARAILKDAPILILDEATSALDSESERHIQAALEELMKTRTTFVIAHRLSTIEKADTIIVLDQGKIVEQGTHAELIQRQGQYAALHKMQFNYGE